MKSKILMLGILFAFAGITKSQTCTYSQSKLCYVSDNNPGGTNTDNQTIYVGDVWTKVFQERNVGSANPCGSPASTCNCVNFWIDGTALTRNGSSVTVGSYVYNVSHPTFTINANQIGYSYYSCQFNSTGTYYMNFTTYYSDGTALPSFGGGLGGTVTVLCPTPSAPNISSCSSATSSSFYANWGSVSLASYYLLDVSTNSSFSSFVYNGLNVGNTTSYNVTGLSSSTTYYYRVKAVNTCGNTGGYSGSNSCVTTGGCPTVTASSSQINITCNGGSNGSITVTASGGTSPCQYSKDGGTNWQGSNVFSGLSAGTYSIRVKDANNCNSSNYSVTITQPSAVTFSTSQTNASCCNCSNGSITVNASGGNSLYQYTKDGGSNWQASNLFSGLVAGTYSILVRDGNSCYSSSQNITITEPGGVNISSTSTVNVTCNGGSNGSIAVSALGGATPYQYSKDNGSTWQLSNTFSNLNAGTYSVKVKDNNNCSSSSSVIISQPSAVSFTYTKSNASCFGCNDGTFSISASGGTPSYQYSKDNGSNWQASNTFSALPAGTYPVKVRDANNCQSTLENIVITQPGATYPDLTTTFINISDASPTAGDAITVTCAENNDASGSSVTNEIGFYLSSNQIIDGSDIPLGTNTAPGLPGNITGLSIVTSVTIPINTPGGTYYIGIRADNNNANPNETNENNNDAFVQITITPYVSSFMLSFPLKEGVSTTASNAKINSVTDHSGNTAYSQTDQMVEDYKGEVGNVNRQLVTGTIYYGWKQSSGQNFIVNGNYNNSVLWYNGHPGYDLSTGRQNLPVYATADGVTVSICGNSNNPQGALILDHGNGYRTCYFHLSELHANVKDNNGHYAPGIQVQRGEQIGKAGNWVVCGSQEPDMGVHLHFEVRKFVNGSYIHVDPYGWEGQGADPYQPLIPNLNVNLWSPNDLLTDLFLLGIGTYGSITSGCQILLYQNGIWRYRGTTNEYGNTFISSNTPFTLHDSLRFVASGYDTIQIAIDSIVIKNGKINVPMAQSIVVPNKIIHPSIKLIGSRLTNQTTADFLISGINLLGYEKIDQCGADGDSVIFTFHPASDSILTINLNTGFNQVMVRLLGNNSTDTTILSNFVNYLPDTSASQLAYTVTIIPSVLERGVCMYVNDSPYENSINSDTMRLKLFEGINRLRFSKFGYIDKYFTVSRDTTFSLSLTPQYHYSSADSSIMIFSSNKTQSWGKMTLRSQTLNSDAISVKIGLVDYNLIGLQAVSETFSLRRLIAFNAQNLEAFVELDQIENLREDSTYLLCVGDNTYQKYNLDSTNICSYDSAVQKLEFENLTFNNGADQTQGLVLMKRQAPNTTGNSINMIEDTPLQTTFLNYFSDPDSIHDDMVFAIESAGGGIASIQQIGDSLTITPSPNFNGNTSLTVTAMHDWLTKTITIPVNITAVNDAPSLSTLNNLSFCTNGSATLNITPTISDVDNQLTDISETISVISSSNVNVSVNALSFTQTQQHQFNFTTSQTEVSVFTVQVIANDGTDNSNTQTFIITVNMLPLVTATASDNQLCFGDFVTLTGGGASTYTWSNNAQNGVPIAPQSSVQYTVSGTDANNCSSTASTIVYVFNLPNVSAHATATTICDGSPVTLFGDSAFTYIWSNSVQDGTAFNPSATNTYSVTGTDGNGCSNTASLTINVNPKPNPQISANGPTTFCNGNSVTLSSSVIGSYLWNTSETTSNITVQTTGNYSVTVTDLNNCTGSSNLIAITVDSILVPVIIPNGSTTFCEGESVNLVSSITGNYLWSTSETSQSIIVDTAGSYSLTVTDANNCEGTAAPVLVTVDSLPSVSIPEIGTVYNNYPEFTLSGGTPLGGIYFVDGVVSATFEPASESLGVHTVIYRYTDGNGCSDTAIATIIVEQFVGTTEIANDISISIHPNPSGGIVTIHCKYEGKKKITISVFNLIGEEMYSKNCELVKEELKTEIDFSSISNGIYLIRIDESGKSIYRKIILSH